MPFDFTTTDNKATDTTAARAAHLCAVACGRVEPTAKIAYRRACAMEALQIAKTSPAVDWQEVAEALGAVMPKTTAPKAPAPAAEPRGEWFAYTQKQRRGAHRYFHASRRVVLRFDDGETFAWSLVHRANKDRPDWAGAIRGAVQANGRADIWQAYDPARQVHADPDQARETAETMLREMTGSPELVEWIGPAPSDLTRQGRKDRVARIGEIARAFAG